MKLLYFTQFLSNVGGLERTLSDKANFMVSHGHEVIIVTYEHKGEPAYELDGRVEHVDLECHFFTLYRLPFYRRLSGALKLKRLLRQKLRAVAGSFRPDVVVVTIPNTENFICDVVKAVKPLPVVIESHLAYGHTVIRRGATETWLYHIFSPLRAVRSARLLIALTSADAGDWRRNGVKNVVRIPNPVTRYDMELPSADKDLKRIICVGRLAPQKRFDRMIDAFSLLADRYPLWHVDIFGDGENRDSLRRHIVEKGLADRVRILPPTKDIYAEFMRSQFFVMSSDFEGFGLVIVEAMACGLPVVSTACPYGPSDIIEDGRTGLLAKLDTGDLSAKMEWMITHVSERQAMGREARNAAARYRKEIVVPQWEQAYESVITNKQQKDIAQ